MAENYIPVNCHIPFMKRYAYMDDENDHAFGLFEKYNCNVHISRGAFKKNGTDFIIHLCLVRKKQNSLFLKIMNDLDRNLSILKGQDYIQTRDELFDALYSEHEKLWSGQS